ncbi:Host cell factor 2 [Homalodisca vitripennis]|nr:Host cell factor 2 [Homalodisca vitripennis]
MRHASLRHGSPHTVGLGCPQSKTSFCVVRFQVDPDWHHYCMAPRAVTAQSAQSRHYPRSWGFEGHLKQDAKWLDSDPPSVLSNTLAVPPLERYFPSSLGFTRTKVCCKDLWYLEVEKPYMTGRVQLVRASTNSLEVLWTGVPTAENYVLQVMKYDIPPTAQTLLPSPTPTLSPVPPLPMLSPTPVAPQAEGPPPVPPSNVNLLSPTALSPAPTVLKPAPQPTAAPRRSILQVSPVPVNASASPTPELCPTDPLIRLTPPQQQPSESVGLEASESAAAVAAAIATVPQSATVSPTVASPPIVPPVSPPAPTTNLSPPGSMTGIHALAAAASATQKIKMSPSTQSPSPSGMRLVQSPRMITSQPIRIIQQPRAPSPVAVSGNQQVRIAAPAGATVLKTANPQTGKQQQIIVQKPGSVQGSPQIVTLVKTSQGMTVATSREQTVAALTGTVYWKEGNL